MKLKWTRHLWFEIKSYWTCITRDGEVYVED